MFKKNVVWPCVVLIFLFTSYVSSYFIVVRWTIETGDEIAGSFAGHAGEGYAPVYWLIDETPLRKPLLAISRMCGVESEVEYASRQRLFVKKMFY